MSKLVRALGAALLGAGAALLVSCSGSGAKSLIPPADAGPLKNDFEAIAQAARSGQGNCASTEAAIVRAEGDLAKLPAAVDRGLRARLHEGLTKLREDALGLCARTPTPSTTTTAPTTTSTQTTTTAPTTTETTPTQSTSTTNTSTAPGPGGGTPAPGEGEGSGEGGEGAPEASSQSFKHSKAHDNKHGPKAKGDALRTAPEVGP